MIARIKRREQSIRMLRIACDHIEVDDRVKMPGRANPLVDCLAIRFALGFRTRVLRADVRQNRRANRLDPMRMRPCDDLRICTMIPCTIASCSSGETSSSRANVPRIVHALQHDQLANARLRQHIAIEARQRIRAEAVQQQPISANSLIHYTARRSRTPAAAPPAHLATDRCHWSSRHVRR